MPNDTNTRGRLIRQGQKAAAVRLQAIGNQSSEDLLAAFEAALARIRSGLESLTDASGTVPIQSLPAAEQLVNDALSALNQQTRQIVDSSLSVAATLGIDPWSEVADVISGVDLRNEVLEWVQTFVDENGLQLSDRLWRVDRLAKTRVIEAIQGAVIEGRSASQAARDLLLRGRFVPFDLESKAGRAEIARIQKELGDALLTGQGNPWFNAERVMRTEINRAYGEVAVRAAAEHPDVVAVRFLLSPRHPRPDICDMHATANLHGLGPGVYPIDNHPWPAHPNTLSYLEPIFIDEITTEDRKGRETMTNFINGLPADRQDAILGGKAKGWAWRAGHLDPRQVSTPWYKVRAQLQRRGIDIPQEHAP